MKRRVLGAICLISVCSAALAATVSRAPGAVDSFGVGLKLGAVVNKIPVGSSFGPWLVWDKSTCSYQTTSTHPKAYVANVRKVVGGPKKIGYMNYGDIDPFGVANSKNVKKMATLAGFTLNVYNLKYPSTTEPLPRPRNSVLKKDTGVIQAQQLDSISNAFLDILQKKGCIPTVQMYLKVANVPSFGAVWPDSGTTQGAWFAQQAKAKQLEAGRHGPGRVHRPGRRSERQHHVRHGSQGADRERVRDPEEEHLQDHLQVLADPVGRGARERLVHRAPERQAHHDQHDRRRADAGRDQRAEAERPLQRPLTISTGADGLGPEADPSGLEGASVAYFPERYGEWLVPILEDVMAGNPVPSFTGSEAGRDHEGEHRQVLPRLAAGDGRVERIGDRPGRRRWRPSRQRRPHV